MDLKWVSLTKVNPCGGLTFVQDVEANRYPVVAIGVQCWMAENLKTTKYNDGTPIPYNPDNWNINPVPAYCWYNNDPDSLGQIYGALYNAFVGLDTNSNKVCPTGWHIPGIEEVQMLYSVVEFPWPLMEAGTVHWANNPISSNTTGFTALPGGRRLAFVGFTELGDFGYWWTSTRDSSIENAAHLFRLSNGLIGTGQSEGGKGQSLRCIKDN